jgi:hypothetical protein
MGMILSCFPIFEQCICCDLNESEFDPYSDSDSDPDPDFDLNNSDSIMYDSTSEDFLLDRIIT